MRSTRRLLIGLIVLSLVLPTTLSTAAAADVLNPAGETEALSGALSDAQSGANETATPTPNGSTSGESDQESATTTRERPDAADSVRILPVQLDPDFVSTAVVDAGKQYNTSGPFAFWSFSEPVDQVAIQEPGAAATVLDGGHTVKVEYEPEAAATGEQTLYLLEIYFSDGSTRELEIYASETDVDVGHAQMRQYRPFVMDVLNDAEDNGYERNPEGAQAHYDDVKDTAQLLDSLFVERASQLFGAIVAIITNPLGIGALLALAALISAYFLWSNAEVLEQLSNAIGKSKQLRERIWIQYEKDQQTAADTPLRDVVGTSHVYWDDAYQIDTLAGLAELFRDGVPLRRDGETVKIGGVDELDAETIESSWLEAVTREHRLPSEEIALSHGKKALHRMITEYGMGHIYSDAYERTRELIDELDESRDLTRYASESRDVGGAGAGAAAGGDD